MKPRRPWVDPLGACCVAPHDEMSGAPPREPTEPNNEICWLPPPMMREPLPRLPLDAPPMVSDPALLSPPGVGRRERLGGRRRGGANVVALCREHVVDLDGDRVAAVPEELHGDVVPKH